MYAEGPADRLGQQAFAALVHHASLSGTTLLPNLQELSWLQFSHVVQCLPFLSPSLRRVTVYVQATPSRLPAGSDSAVGRQVGRGALGGYSGLLQILDARSPCVEALTLEGIDFDFAASLASDAVFQQLRSLHLGAVSVSTSLVLSHCSKMPRLASLSLIIRDSPGRSRPSSSRGAHSQRQTDVPRLCAIECLRVAGAPSDIEAILESIDSPSFHTVALSVSVPEFDTDGWTRCASLLGARFAPSLRVVSAECRRSATLVPTQARPFSEYVQPLFCLLHLSECTIVIEDPAGVAMTDADVENMATAWRFLRTLEITLRGGPAATLPSIASLSTFTRACVDLATLRLSMSQDVSALESWMAPECGEDAAEGGGGCPCRRQTSRGDLRHLWIAGVRFSKAESDRVVRFLKWCFPRVDLRPMVGAGVLRLE